MKKLRFLLACEESQAVTIELRKLGHEAFSCDLLPCSGGHPEWHYQQDVFEVIDKGWDLMIAHPPCTFLSVAGAWAMSWSQLNNPFLQNQRIKQINAKAQKVQSEDLQNALNNPENSELTF